MKKLMKSKKGVAPLLLVPIVWLVGLVLIGIPVFGTWLKMMFTPAQPISPIWIIVIAFIVLILIFRRK